MRKIRLRGDTHTNIKKQGRVITLLEYNGCTLTKKRFKGQMWEFNMHSNKTGNHTIYANSITKRVLNHWNGFINNQNNK